MPRYIRGEKTPVPPGWWKTLGFLLSVSALAAVGCIDRPVHESSPVTSNLFVDQVPQSSIEKIDLLFVIDNSVSMADKQDILKLAVPGLVRRLTSPACVSSAASDTPGGGAETAPPLDTGDCPEGFEREFIAVNDIHIGVITSSLGGHGGNLCSPSSTAWNETKNDRAHLLPTVRPGLATYDPAGFLAWKGEEETPLETLLDDFQDHVVAAEQRGCGFEASLESWYRFLIEPSPPAEMVVQGDDAVSTGVDEVLLEQRRAFLRPDSLVAIIMLTDENDCSVMDGGLGYADARLGWLTANIDDRFRQFPAASQECDTDPDSECCYSCGSESPPPGCSSCERKRLPEEDRPNVRCFDQKRRFGIDLLYPVERYVTGLTELEVVDSYTGERKANPLLVSPSGAPPRDPSLVFLAGIVGVPWQDIATADSLSGAGLTYLTAAELGVVDPTTGQSRWDVIVGDPGSGVPPADPLMVEQIDPRQGVHPITGDPIARFDTNPLANPINGHDYDNSILTTDAGTDGRAARDDLQYACTFPLLTPRDCSAAGVDPAACDCSPGDDQAKHKPLCEDTVQVRAKAYPGVRQLDVLRQFGDNSIVASICPKSLSGDSSAPGFGYNPAVDALVSRLSKVLKGRCLPRELEVEEATQRVPCAVVEARVEPLDCNAPGRDSVKPTLASVVREELARRGHCGGPNRVDCNSFTLCEIEQLEDDAQTECQNREGATTPGYCYIDPDRDAGDNPALVKDCPATARRKLRFVSSEQARTPAPGSVMFVACAGRSF